MNDWDEPCHECSGKGVKPISIEMAGQGIGALFGFRYCNACSGTGKNKE